MRALVTGATGFVGGHLVDTLLSAGHEVTALVRSTSKGAPLAARGVHLVAGDLHDAGALARASLGQDTTFHVAALTAALSEAEFRRANAEGTALVLAAAERAGVGRLVHVSSLAAAGPAVPGRPLRGDEPPHPVTAYGRSKLEAETLVRKASLPWTIVRPPMVYGPRDREFLRAFRGARQLGIAPVFGDGSQELSAVYAPDLAGALLAAALAPAAAGGTYAACHPERFTQLEFARAVGRAVGREVAVPRLPAPIARPILFVSETAARVFGRPTLLTADKANEFLAPAWTADPAPLERDAGWRATHGIDSGLRLTAEWYRSRGWL